MQWQGCQVVLLETFMRLSSTQQQMMGSNSSFWWIFVANQVRPDSLALPMAWLFFSPTPAPLSFPSIFHVYFSPPPPLSTLPPTDCKVCSSSRMQNLKLNAKREFNLTILRKPECTQKARLTLWRLNENEKNYCPFKLCNRPKIERNKLEYFCRLTVSNI